MQRESSKTAITEPIAIAMGKTGVCANKIIGTIIRIKKMPVIIRCFIVSSYVSNTAKATAS